MSTRYLFLLTTKMKNPKDLNSNNNDNGSRSTRIRIRIRTKERRENLFPLILRVLAAYSISRFTSTCSVGGFQIQMCKFPSSSLSISLSSSSSFRDRNHQRRRSGSSLRTQLFAFNSKNKDDDSYSNDDNDDGSGSPGMEEAFRELEKLQSLDDNDDNALYRNTPPKKKNKDEAFTKAMDELNLKDILSDSNGGEGENANAKPTMESEVELYKDMASELSAASSKEELIVADFKTDLLLADDVDDTNDDEDNDDDIAAAPAIGIGSSFEQKQQLDTKKFMDKAIEEALKEAKEQQQELPDEITAIPDKEAFLDNKEIMSEIEKIFDKANEELLEGLEEIRTEQTSLARLDAERNAKASREKIEEDEKRLEIAQGNMKKMLNRVNEETKNVELAIQDLKKAQEESDRGSSVLVDLKRGGLIKQSTLVGAVLFTFRSGAETIGFLGGDPSHAIPALVQGALAILCIIGFIFV